MQKQKKVTLGRLLDDLSEVGLSDVQSVRVAAVVLELYGDEGDAPAQRPIADVPTTWEQFKAELRNRVKAKGTVGGVAERAGVAASWLSKVFTTSNRPTAVSLRKIGKALGPADAAWIEAWIQRVGR